MHNLLAFLRPSYQSNLAKFFIAHALFNAYFFLPIWAIFVQRRFDASLTQITLIDFAFWISMALTEVPTGAVADTFGRKHSMIVGVLLSMVTASLFGLAPNYTWLLVANSLWAISFTFMSGADLAFLYDTLRELQREEEYPRFRGWALALDIGATGVGGALGAYLATWNLALPFVLYTLLQIPTALLVLSYKEPPRQADGATGQILGYRETIAVTYQAILNRPNLRYVLLYSNLVPVAGMAITITLIQPHAIALGIPLAALGILTMLISLVRVLGSLSSHRIAERLGSWRWLRLAPFLVVAGLLGLGVGSLASLGLFALTVFASPAVRPLIENIMLRQSPGSVRATILSVDNLIFRLLLAFLELAAGYIGDLFGLPAAFTSMALVVGIALGLVLWFWQRVWEPDPGPAASLT